MGVESVRDTAARVRRVAPARWKRESGFRILAPALLVALLLACWEGAVRGFGVAPYILPSPSTVARTLVAERWILFSNAKVTLLEVVVGFCLAFVSAISLGIALAYWRTFRRAALPLIIASQTIPILAIAPIFIIWFGYNLTPRVLMTALICFFPLTVNTVAGFRAVDAETDRLFRALGGTRRDRFLKLAVPSALPHVFTGMKISATLSVIGATVSEWAGSNSGLGHLILSDTGLLDTARIFASITILSSMGILLFALVSALEHVVMPWRHHTRSRPRRRPGVRQVSEGRRR